MDNPVVVHNGRVLLDHVTVTAADFPGALAFYDAVLGALGLTRVIDLGDEEEDDAQLEAVGWGDGEHAVLWLVAGPVTPGRAATVGVHLAFRVAGRAEVEAFHAAALAAGGRSHDAPRRWPIYRRGEFHAIVADPAGNLVEAVAPE